MEKDLKPEDFDIVRLIQTLLPMKWHQSCRIINNWLPQHPRPDTKPICVVEHNGWYLRWSKGPIQGYFWDMYGEHFDHPEWAIYALSVAPPPPNAKGLWQAKE